MSYILDALRRADAERERGAVPGLSSQQHAYVEDDASKPQRPRMLVWAVVALAAALIVAVAWNFVGGGSSGQPAPRPVVEGSVSPAPPAAPVLLPTPAPVLQAPPTTTATSPAPAAPPQATAPLAGTEPATVAPPARHVAPKHPAEAKRVARRDAEQETAPPSTNATTANATSAKVAEPKTTEPKAARAQTESRVYQQSELPEDVRRDLPKLVIGGASYSGDTASRMVMINGQIFHEGDQLAPQLVLERIKLKSAVLSYKGYRYELTF